MLFDPPVLENQKVKFNLIYFVWIKIILNYQTAKATCHFTFIYLKCR